MTWKADKEALDLHAYEMEAAFMFRMQPTPYEEALKRLHDGGTVAEDVATVLRGADWGKPQNYRENTLLLFPDASAPLTAMLSKLKASEPSEPL
jgi:hypothetical protein